MNVAAASRMRLDFSTDAAEFLAVAGTYLAEEPVINTVVATIAHRAVARRADGVVPPERDWWLVVRDGRAAVVGVGQYWFWVTETGRRVHLARANPPSFGVARIGPVYTPRAERGRGWASNAVAEVSRLIVAGGARACLFADQANPISNKIYAAIGYRPIVDMANLLIVG